MQLQGSSMYAGRTVPLWSLVLVAVLLVAMLFLLNNLDAERAVGAPTEMEISAKLKQLADAIKAENTETIGKLLDWFEKWGIEVNLDNMAGRFICSWCLRDQGPSATEENSAAICEQCRIEFLE